MLLTTTYSLQATQGFAQSSDFSSDEYGVLYGELEPMGDKSPEEVDSAKLLNPIYIALKAKSQAKQCKRGTNKYSFEWNNQIEMFPCGELKAECYYNFVRYKANSNFMCEGKKLCSCSETGDIVFPKS